MWQAKKHDLVAHRGLTFFQAFVFLDNFTGMTTCEFSIRNHPDNPTALILLNLVVSGEGTQLVYAASDTVANHILGGYLSTDILRLRNPETGDPYDLTDVIDVSLVNVVVQIDSRIPAPQEQGDDWVGSYDFIPTRPTYPAVKYAFGKFTVKPRANIT